MAWSRFTLSPSLRLADILKRDVVLVPAATPLRDAACLLHEQQAQAVLVMRDGRVIALLTARELLPGLLPDGSADAPGCAVGVLDVASAPLCIGTEHGRVESVFAPMRQAGASLVVVVDAAGAPLGVVGSCELLRSCIEARGVTEAVPSDESERVELRRLAQERWKYAIEATDRGIWDWQVGTEQIYFSPKWLALLGYAEGELPAQLDSWLSHVHPDDLSTLQAELARHLAGGNELCSCDHRVRRKDGRYTWLLVRGKVIQSGRDGRPHRMIGTCTDISDRKQMEEELRRAVDKLAQREAALSQAQSLARIGSWMFDLSRGRFSGSDEALRLSGWRRGQHYGLDELLSMVHADDRRRLRQAWSDLCQGEQRELNLELRFTVDGVLRWVEARAQPQHDRHGRLERIVGVCLDTTERKQAELVQQTRLAVLDRLVQAATDVDPVLAEIATRLEQVHTDWRVAITLHDTDCQPVRIAAAPGLPAWYVEQVNRVAAGSALHDCGPARRVVEPALCANLLDDPDWAPWRDEVGRLGLHACWSVPFKDDAGVVRGSLAVYREASGRPDPVELGLINEFCRLASLAEQRVRAGAALRQAAAVLAATHDGVVVTDLGPAIVSVNKAYCDMVGYSEDELLGQNPGILRSGRHDQAFYTSLWDEVALSGYWQGEIWNRRKNGEVFPQWVTISTVRDEQGQPSHYVGVCTDISQIKHSEQRLEQLAHYDPLTNLPNRLLAHSRLRHALEQAARKSRLLAVLFIDLDRFKTVNDSLGHPAGDELLAGFATRALQCLGESDTLARLGGDEFLVILEDLERPDDAALVAQALLDALQTPFTLGSGQELYVTASVGLSLYPEDGLDADELIQHADSAMYQAKAHGRNTFRFYTESLTRHANERLGLELQMRRALQQGEFVLHYQPLVDTQDSGTVAVEALVRWQHPRDGLVAPTRFIGLAEETGLILPLGDWVLRTACRQARAWFDAGMGLTVAVNLSARQFLQHDLVDKVRKVLAETGLPASHLELEITESVIMERPELAIDTLRGLRSLGVQLSIDDFGTGYSSLAYLKRFPVQKLKIDRSFIDGLPVDLSDQAIVRATITMAHTLGIRTLAEGVETEDQLDVLRALHCDYGQGWLFSRALPGAELEAWLEQGSSAWAQLH
ncbi:MAG: hypothetical protein RLY71_2198 [Pseudomonadota bacterium]|jgi:diguanylate cyclase (GGDEF)-like protein/PAS domain S-box-containing protein